MNATSKTVRLVSAALAASIGVALVIGKAHLSDEYTRLTTRSDVFVLPVTTVIGERSGSLAATENDRRAN